MWRQCCLLLSVCDGIFDCWWRQLFSCRVVALCPTPSNTLGPQTIFWELALARDDCSKCDAGAGCDKTKKQWLSRTGSQDREQAYLETFFWTLDNCAHLGTIWADDNREELLPLRRTFKRLWFKGFLEERKTTQNCQLKPFSRAICSLITWPWDCSETTIESRCLSKAWLELNYWCSWETQPSKLTKWIANDIRNVKANIVTGTMGHELSDNNSINVFYQLSKAFIACKTFNSFSKLFAHITICHRLEPYFDW